MTSRRLCLFTPTYNRAYTLERLFDSLVRQTSLDFDWLIVDDGSTDDTEELVGDLASRAPFSVIYIKQENGGKQRAHNTAVFACENELFFCVDSDDELAPNAIERLLGTWDAHADDPHVAGVISLCGPDASTPYGKNMPDDLPFCTMWDLYNKHGHRGDTALMHRTDILRCFPFVLDEHEKFMAEPFVYHQIDQHYTLAVLDAVTIVREYLPDGYTANVRRVTKENPIDYMNLKKLYIGYSDTFRLKYENSILYLVGCMLSNTPHGVRNAPYPAIAALALPPAWLLTKTVYR